MAKAQKIKVGDSVPVFSLLDQDSVGVDIQQVIGKPLVIYFYPKDDTPGCTAEACAFRDSYESFSDANVEVVGISADSPEKHKAFAEKHRLPFTLLSDKGNAVRKLFGVPTSLFGWLPGRVTYIINEEGKVVHIFNSQINATQHVEEALKHLNLK